MYNEKQLIIALRNGSHEAFRQLYEHYQTRIFYFIYGILHSRPDTEELFQSVFLKIWENRTIIDEEGSFSGYIYQIARNSIYNHLEKQLYARKLETQLSRITAIDDYGSVENKVMSDDLNIFINRLIEQLPERRKEIFLLHYRQHKTYKEITEALRISENTVDTQIRRSLDFLRTEISKEFGLWVPVAAISLLTLFV